MTKKKTPTDSSSGIEKSQTTEPECSPPRHPCFIDQFVEATDDLGIPGPYALWGAIWLVGAVAGRHIWGRTRKGLIYPNLYVLFLAPPAVGKGIADRAVRRVLKAVPDVVVVSQYISSAALFDELDAGMIVRTGPDGKLIQYHQALILTTEWGETFQKYDPPLYSMLSDWWDNPDDVAERKRGLREGRRREIFNITCSMLAGVTPGMIHEQIPSVAWRQGFLTRTIFVYVPVPEQTLLFDLDAGDEDIDKGWTKFEQALPRLEKLLKRIAQGRTGIVPAAHSHKLSYTNWVKGGKNPAPTHPRLEGYRARREHQLAKLTLISTLSRGATETSAWDFERARTWLETTEYNLNDVFLEMNETEDSEKMAQLREHVYANTRGGPGMTAAEVFAYLVRIVPQQQIRQFLQSAQVAGFIEVYQGPDNVQFVRAVET